MKRRPTTTEEELMQDPPWSVDYGDGGQTTE